MDPIAQLVPIVVEKSGQRAAVAVELDHAAGRPGISRMGRISIVPFVAGGIRAAMPIASSRSLASIM